ncbi:glycine betaine ABC transporter substrate-binding protein [Pontivivens insulae]|uniref:ABC-type glycine betaine transport system substrate-binding domain-containing protein n=1 Tax=Pontivivens insulae TaxID=1639689 RepID=A0A2R8A855_9RHOB|nr:glycine betaine ABC transporter substrate-binding protein [Pontivivens insulae]RED18519.1 glycine betaine/proline transport system substrate-binding protein [Pontivivens insulae]SPF28417.1 hypothetical protein POI8812_00716 [Pontivivens insulae]
MRTPTLLFGILLSVSAAQAQSADPIRIGQPSWFSGELISLILERVIEDNFDVEVERVPGSNGEIYDGMVAEPSTYDIHADSWMPNQIRWVGPGQEAGTIALSGTNYRGVDGMCVPTYVVEDYGISRVEDLISDRGRDIFDINGDGRGDLWVGADGWVSQQVMLAKADGYDLTSQLDTVVMGEAEWQAILFDALAARQPVAFYCYQPHSWFAYDYLTMLEEPPHDPENYTLVSPEDSENWLEESNIASASVIKNVQIAYATRLRDSHPQIATLLSQFGVEAEQMTELIFLAQVKEIGMEFVVEDWVAANQALIQEWVRVAQQS